VLHIGLVTLLSCKQTPAPVHAPTHTHTHTHTHKYVILIACPRQPHFPKRVSVLHVTRTLLVLNPEISGATEYSNLLGFGNYFPDMSKGNCKTSDRNNPEDLSQCLFHHIQARKRGVFAGELGGAHYTVTEHLYCPVSTRWFKYDRDKL
jgi:hypothetical protein